MGRRIIYKILKNASNRVSKEEWEDIDRLQHWYNSEFRWSTGKLSLKRYVVFANFEDFVESDPPLGEIIRQRTLVLQHRGLGNDEIVEQMERDQLVTVKWGGYYDGCLGSGFTRVADNEWNAYLVCDFLLKASRIAPGATIDVEDEGMFLKTRVARFRKGEVRVRRQDIPAGSWAEDETVNVFSLVDPEKYDRHKRLRNSVPEFNNLKSADRRSVLRDWNWLGFGNGTEADASDGGQTDLNKKVSQVTME